MLKLWCRYIKCKLYVLQVAILENVCHLLPERRFDDPIPKNLSKDLM